MVVRCLQARATRLWIGRGQQSEHRSHVACLIPEADMSPEINWSLPAFRTGTSGAGVGPHVNGDVAGFTVWGDLSAHSRSGRSNHWAGKGHFVR